MRRPTFRGCQSEVHRRTAVLDLSKDASQMSETLLSRAWFMQSCRNTVAASSPGEVADDYLRALDLFSNLSKSAIAGRRPSSPLHIPSQLGCRPCSQQTNLVPDLRSDVDTALLAEIP